MDEKTIAIILEPLDSQKTIAVKKAFTKMEIALDAMTDEYNEVMEKEITTEVSGEARALRLRISKVRTDGEKWKTKEKAQYLQAGNAIQGLFNYLKKDTTRKEEALKGVEEHFAREAQNKIAKLKKERLEILEPYEVDSTFVDLGNMPEEAWKAHHAGIVAAFEKETADKLKNSEAQKKKDAQQLIFDERKELLMPYAQFSPFIDLIHETTEEEFQELFTLMKTKMKEFTDNQASLSAENEKLKEENKILKEPEDVNKFKKNVLFGFSGGAPASKKYELATDKDTSLGEMLGFDEPKESGNNIEWDKNTHTLNVKVSDPVIQIGIEPAISEKERLHDCAEYLESNLTYFSNESAIQAVKSSINNIRGILMIV